MLLDATKLILVEVAVRELISGMGAPLTGDGRGHEGEKGVGGIFLLSPR